MIYKGWKLTYRMALILLMSLVFVGCQSSEYPSKGALAAWEQAVVDCFNTWVNTAASPETIETGLSSGILTKNHETGLLTTDTTNSDFDSWTISEPDVPWSQINIDLRLGPGCMYQSMDMSHASGIDQAVECLSQWVGSQAPQKIINSGIGFGVLELASTNNSYIVNIEHIHFRRWIAEDSINNPWGDIRIEALYGTGYCPYS